jgi:hypothetical protein
VERKGLANPAASWTFEADEADEAMLVELLEEAAFNAVPFAYGEARFCLFG